MCAGHQKLWLNDQQCPEAPPKVYTKKRGSPIEKLVLRYVCISPKTWFMHNMRIIFHVFISHAFCIMYLYELAV